MGKTIFESRLREPQEGCHVEEVAGEIVVLSTRRGEVHHLNETASAVYRSLRDGFSAEQASASLSERYYVDHGEARLDVQKMIDAFMDSGMLVRAA